MKKKPLEKPKQQKYIVRDATGWPKDFRIADYNRDMEAYLKAKEEEKKNG